MTNASNLLPWHPRRLDDEILSSWMLSIASGNGISVRSLCAWLGSDDRIREIDSIKEYYHPRGATTTTLVLKQLLYLLYGCLPFRVYLVAESVESVRSGLWSAFSPQILRQDRNVVIEPLKILFLYKTDALKDFGGVNLG